MRRITLVRHGEAAAGWTDDHDPGLSSLGRSQAEDVAIHLAAGPAGPIVTSPLRRTRETAAPLARRWSVEPAVDERVAEIPSPVDDLAQRGPWLRTVMTGTWRDAGADLAAWRDDVLAAVAGYDDGTVVFTHFIAINVVVGAATGDDRVTVFTPGNCSMTVLDVDTTPPTVLTLGAQAETVVN